MKTKTTYVLLLVITLLSCGQEPSPDLEGVWYLSNPYRYTEYDFEEVIVSQPQKRDKAPQDTSCYLNYMLPVLEVSDGQGLWNGGSLGRSGWPVSINARERYLEVEKHVDCRYRLYYKIQNDSLIAQKDARQSMMNSIAEEIAQVGLTQRSYLCAIDSRRRGFEQIRWVGIDQIDDLGVMQQFDSE